MMGTKFGSKSAGNDIIHKSSHVCIAYILARSAKTPDKMSQLFSKRCALTTHRFGNDHKLYKGDQRRFVSATVASYVTENGILQDRKNTMSWYICEKCIEDIENQLGKSKKTKLTPADEVEARGQIAVIPCSSSYIQLEGMINNKYQLSS